MPAISRRRDVLCARLAPSMAGRDRSVRVPRLLEIRRGLLDELPRLLQKAGFDLERTIVGSGGVRTSRLAERVGRDLDAAGSSSLVRELAGHVDDVAELEMRFRDERPTVCIAVGGGKVIDTLKQVCCTSATPFVSVPTSLSHDGLSSPIASLVHADGRRHSLAAVMPEAVLVDLDVVESAPLTTRKAGAADLLSNLVALEDWRLAARRGKDEFDGYSALISEEAARSFLYLVDASAKSALEMLARGLVLSGLAMATAGSSRPCSGAEHLISHSLDEILGTEARLHGEQVALGTLITYAARGSTPTVVTRAYESWDLPRRAADLGLSTDVLVDAVRRAPSTRPSRYTILNEIDLGRSAVEELVNRAIGVAR